MEIDYWVNSTRYSVMDLIRDLGAIVQDNPHLDFERIGVSLNDEYTAVKAKLESWEPIGKEGVLRYNVDIY